MEGNCKGKPYCKSASDKTGAGFEIAGSLAKRKRKTLTGQTGEQRGRMHMVLGEEEGRTADGRFDGSQI